MAKTVAVYATFTAFFAIFFCALATMTMMTQKDFKNNCESISQAISKLPPNSKSDLYYANRSLHVEIEKGDHNLKVSFPDFGKKNCVRVLVIRDFLRDKYGNFITSAEPSQDLCSNNLLGGLNSPPKSHTSAFYEFSFPG